MTDKWKEINLNKKQNKQTFRITFTTDHYDCEDILDYIEISQGVTILKVEVLED